MLLLLLLFLLIFRLIQYSIKSFTTIYKYCRADWYRSSMDITLFPRTQLHWQIYRVYVCVCVRVHTYFCLLLSLERKYSNMLNVIFCVDYRNVTDCNCMILQISDRTLLRYLIKQWPTITLINVPWICYGTQRTVKGSHLFQFLWIRMPSEVPQS